MTEENRLINMQHEDATYDHVLKYTGVFGGVEGLKVLLGLVKNKLSAMFLGNVGVGLGAVYGNIAENINSATNFGLSFSSVRSVSELFEEGSDKEIRQFVCVVRTWCLWSAILAAVLCIVGAPYLCDFFFGDRSYQLPVMLLSVAVAAMPIEAGECAVLKGMRCLKRVAMIETMASLCSLLTSIPLYYVLGTKGVIYALVLTQASATAIHLYVSVRLVPYRVKVLSKDVFMKGLKLLQLGVPYALAAVLSAFTLGAIFHFIEDHGQIGLYKNGYLLLSFYSSLAFAATDVDFFPRLSSVNHDVKRMNKLVNQQIDVCLNIVTPLLLLLLFALPYLVPILLTNEFLPIVGMCTCGVMQIFFRGIVLPTEYIALAKGQSLIYLLVEVFSYVCNYFAIIYFYDTYGLLGVGIAMSLMQFAEMVFVCLLYSQLFGFKIAGRTIVIALSQLLLLSVGLASCFSSIEWLRYAATAPLMICSAILSVRVLGNSSQVLKRMIHRVAHNHDCHCCD